MTLHGVPSFWRANRPGFDGFGDRKVYRTQEELVADLASRNTQIQQVAPEVGELTAGATLELPVELPAQDQVRPIATELGVEVAQVSEFRIR